MSTHELVHNVAGDVVGTAAKTTTCDKHGYTSRGGSNDCPYCKQINDTQEGKR